MAIKSLLIPAQANYISKTKMSKGVYLFKFRPLTPMQWQAGQDIVLEISLADGSEEQRAFSIASIPSEKDIWILAKTSAKIPDEYRKALNKLRKNDNVRLRGPVGKMTLREDREKYAFLAYGLAIAPFRAILKSLAKDPDNSPKITLFYLGNKTTHFFRDELAEYKTKLKNLQINYIYLPERITGHIIEEALGPELKETTYLLSGSAKSKSNYRKTLEGLHIPSKQILSNPNLRPKYPTDKPGVIKKIGRIIGY